MARNLGRANGRAAAWAEGLAAAPPIQELVSVAQAALSEGIAEDVMRARVKSHAEAIGLASWRFLLPGINRKMMRYPFPQFLLEAGKYYSKHTRHKTISSFIESFTENMGFDDWIIDNAIALARTGEPLPLTDSLFGAVHVQHMTLGGESTDVVMVAAGPASDFEALAEEFLATCQQTFPEASLERPLNELRDARWFRAFQEDIPDAEIAWSELGAKYPRQIVYQNPKFTDEHRRLVATIKQARKRFYDRVTEILDIVSPDSETD